MEICLDFILKIKFASKSWLREKLQNAVFNFQVASGALAASFWPKAAWRVRLWPCWRSQTYVRLCLRLLKLDEEQTKAFIWKWLTCSSKDMSFTPSFSLRFNSRWTVFWAQFLATERDMDGGKKRRKPKRCMKSLRKKKIIWSNVGYWLTSNIAIQILFWRMTISFCLEWMKKKFGSQSLDARCIKSSGFTEGL